MFHPDEHIAAHADDFLHGLLDAADADHVRKHTADCEACRTALAHAEKRRTALMSLPAHEPSEQLLQSTLQDVEVHEQRRRRRRRRLFTAMGIAAAASVLILSGFHLYYVNLKPSPSDLRVYGQTQLLAGSPASLRVRLMNHDSGRPIAGVPVSIALRPADGEPLELVSFTTDEYGSGQPRFNLPDWAPGEYELRVAAQTPGAADVVAHKVRLRRPARVLLSSDKPVYQPGQTIQVRALGLRLPQLKPLAEKASLFTIRDPRNNIIFKKRLATSKYGIAAIDCPLAREITEGPYTVACVVANSESRLTVNVHKYVLPKFKIALTPDKPFYQPGDRACIALDAQYVFGKPAAGATVDVVAKSVNASDMEHRAKVETDAQGKSQIEVPLPATFGVGEANGGRFAVDVTLTDTAGQKQTASVSSLVTTNPLKVEIIPESGMLVRGIANRVYFFVANPDGQPARATLTVAELRRELRTNEAGVAVLEVTPTTEEVSLSARARDVAGLTGWRSVKLTCGKPGEAFLVRTDRAVYSGGDTMHLEVLGGGKQPVFLDILRDGQTVLTTTVDLKDGRGSLAVDLPPELFGVLRLCAYRLGTDGTRVQQMRSFYVRQPGQLRVWAKLDRKEYRPGQRARVTLTLTDKDGKPTPGALSLSAVDESIFQIGTVAPEQQLMLPEKELRSLNRISPWSPEKSVPNDKKQQLLEQAVFACTATTTIQPGEGRRQRRGPYSLSAVTYADKSVHVEEDRQSGLSWVSTGWKFFALGVVVFAYAVMWFFCSWRAIQVIHWAGCVSLVTLFVSRMLDSEKDGWRSYGFSRRSDISQAQGALTFRPRGESLANADEGLDPEVPTIYSLDRIEDVSVPGPVDPNAAVGIFVASKEANALVSIVSGQKARLRQWFPETLLWRPQLITDDRGRYTLDIPLADSITTWRLSASAVTLDGRLGSNRADLRVFQPFFVDLDLPVSLTRNDEVTLRAVVHNHLDKPQTVQLLLKRENWFDVLGGVEQRLDLGPKQVRSVGYRLKVKKAGTHQLEVSASAGRLQDRLRKAIEVVSDGERVEFVHNGTLRQSTDVPLTLPKDAIEGSSRATLKIYPSAFSQLVEGLDNIFQMPYGCFEQTSSTTYPNILALDYLQRIHKSNPAVESKARRYIHLGYQRLLSFEVSGGGFDWYGRAPANVALTAYGLMEFEDMARVHDVNAALIERTRAWLMAQRAPDGSWRGDSHFHGSAYSTTAYVAWAVFRDATARLQADPTLGYLLAAKPEDIRDPYVLALACNALLTLDPKGNTATPYLKRLESMKKGNGKRAWFSQEPDAQTMFYGSGPSGRVETTALAVLALVEAGRSPELTRAALSWLVTQKDGRGTWHSTQATVLALKALLAGSNTGLGGDRERLVRITLGDRLTRELKVAADQAEVVQQIDLTPYLRPGTQTLRLAEPTGTEPVYQVTFRYHVPRAKEPKGALAVVMAYDRTKVAVGDTIQARATVRNWGPKTVSMVMLDLPIPAGFTLVRDDLETLVNGGTIDRFQVTPRGAVVYLRRVEPGRRGVGVRLTYRLRATSPVQVAVPGARVYAYYDPHNEGRSGSTRMTATEKR